jgi:hypothetical protein
VAAASIAGDERDMVGQTHRCANLVDRVARRIVEVVDGRHEWGVAAFGEVERGKALVEPAGVGQHQSQAGRHPSRPNGVTIRGDHRTETGRYWAPWRM